MPAGVGHWPVCGQGWPWRRLGTIRWRDRRVQRRGGGGLKNPGAWDLVYLEIIVIDRLLGD
jgi:hypothetical protein